MAPNSVYLDTVNQIQGSVADPGFEVTGGGALF